MHMNGELSAFAVVESLKREEPIFIWGGGVPRVETVLLFCLVAFSNYFTSLYELLSVSR